MVTIYQFDSRRVFTGVSRETMGNAGVPLGWTRLAPPQLAEGEWAVFRGSKWETVTVEPAFPVPVLPQILKTDKWTVEADSTDFVSVTFGSTTTVHFIVEGELYSVEQIGGLATLEITADAVGPVQVQVQNQQLVITAVEVQV